MNGKYCVRSVNDMIQMTSFLVALLGLIGLSHDNIYTQKDFQINCDLLTSFVRAVWCIRVVIGSYQKLLIEIRQSIPKGPIFFFCFNFLLFVLFRYYLFFFLTHEVNCCKHSVFSLSFTRPFRTTFLSQIFIPELKMLRLITSSDPNEILHWL